MTAAPGWMLYAGRLWRYIYEQGSYGQGFSLFSGLQFLFHPLTQASVDDASGLRHARVACHGAQNLALFPTVGLMGESKAYSLFVPKRPFEGASGLWMVFTCSLGPVRDFACWTGFRCGWFINKLPAPASPAVSCKTCARSCVQVLPTSLRSWDAHGISPLRIGAMLPAPRVLFPWASPSSLT